VQGAVRARGLSDALSSTQLEMGQSQPRCAAFRPASNWLVACSR
jgi:hypothetical protein